MLSSFVMLHGSNALEANAKLQAELAEVKKKLFASASSKPSASDHGLEIGMVKVSRPTIPLLALCPEAVHPARREIL